VQLCTIQGPYNDANNELQLTRNKYKQLHTILAPENKQNLRNERMPYNTAN